MVNIHDLSLKGKVAIVTGGRHGIGRAIALAFAEAGADIVVCDLVEDGKLETVAGEVESLGRRCLAVRTDVTRKSDVDNLVSSVMNEFSVIDILVNNAGVCIRERLLDHSEEDWDTVIDTNLKGCYLCSQAVGKRMVDQKKGNIINITSNIGILPAQNRGAYCISRAGIIMLTKVLALELGSYDIRVNAIAPGWVKTKFTEVLWSNPEIFNRVTTASLMGRWGETSDIASAALFLASDVSSYITAQTIVADGGLTAYFMLDS